MPPSEAAAKPPLEAGRPTVVLGAVRRARLPREAPRRPARPGGLRLPRTPVPTEQYVPAVAAGGLLFVSGQDAEAGGRLVYRGRVGREVSRSGARAAIRLATLNGLAVADAALGSLSGARRCAVLAC